jgi:hypothetical protein
MAYEHQPGQGAIYNVKNKKHEKAPDRDGLLIADQDYKRGDVIKLSGWTRRGNWGELISIKVNNWKPGDAPPAAREVYSSDSDVPF